MTPDEALAISDRFSKSTKPRNKTANDQVRETLAVEVRRLRSEVKRMNEAYLHTPVGHVIEKLQDQREMLLIAATGARDFLKPCLTEPGRSVFWDLVNAIKAVAGGVR